MKILQLFGKKITGNIERLTIDDSSPRTVIRVARLWSNDASGPREYLLGIPFNTKKDVIDLKRVLKKSRSHIYVTEQKIELDEDYVVS